MLPFERYERPLQDHLGPDADLDLIPGGLKIWEGENGRLGPMQSKALKDAQQRGADCLQTLGVADLARDHRSQLAEITERPFFRISARAALLCHDLRSPVAE